MSNTPEERTELLDLLMGFFDGDEDKVSLWMVTWNPAFGCSPKTMVAVGYYEKLLKWAKQQIADNEQEPS